MENNEMPQKRTSKRNTFMLAIKVIVIVVALPTLIWLQQKYISDHETQSYRNGVVFGTKQGIEIGYARAQAEQAIMDSLAEDRRRAEAAARASQPKKKILVRRPVVQNFKTIGLEILKDEQGNPVPSN